MNHVFIARNEYSAVLQYIANVTYELEKEAIGAQTVVVCKDMTDVIKYLDRIQDFDYRDSICIIGIIPTVAEMESIRSMAGSAAVDLFLGQHQLTTEIEYDESLQDPEDLGLLGSVWMNMLSGDRHSVPNWIKTLDEELQGSEVTNPLAVSMREVNERLLTMKKSDAMQVLNEASKSNGEYFVEFMKES